MPIVVIIVGVLLVAGIGYALITNNESQITTETQNQTETAAPATEETSPATTSTTEGDYQDGQYTATAQYLTPTRIPHDVTVSLTIEDAQVTAAETLFDGDREFSNNHQSWFDQEYKSQVVGVSLDDILLSRTGGASLTTRAFNQALEEIKDQASTS